MTFVQHSMLLLKCFKTFFKCYFYIKCMIFKKTLCCVCLLYDNAYQSLKLRLILRCESLGIRLSVQFNMAGIKFIFTVISCLQSTIICLSFVQCNILATKDGGIANPSAISTYSRISSYSMGAMEIAFRHLHAGFCCFEVQRRQTLCIASSLFGSGRTTHFPHIAAECYGDGERG